MVSHKGIEYYSLFPSERYARAYRATPPAPAAPPRRELCSDSSGRTAWSQDGILCTGETYKAAVKLTFAKGAALPDPAGLFNASLEGNTRRAIDIHEGEALEPEAFKALIRAAAALNGGKRGRGSTAAGGAS